MTVDQATLDEICKSLGQPPGKYFIFMIPDTGELFDSNGKPATVENAEVLCSGFIYTLPMECQAVEH